MATNEDVAHRYAAASCQLDFDALAAMRHPDWQASWPQSGERIV